MKMPGPFVRLTLGPYRLCPTNCGSQFSVAVTREGRTMCRCGHDWSVPSLCPECGKPIQVRVGERSSRYRCPDGHTWGVP